MEVTHTHSHHVVAGTRMLLATMGPRWTAAALDDRLGWDGAMCVLAAMPEESAMAALWHLVERLAT